jgi:hypothetical protein
MDLSQYRSNAALVPPTAPASPSTGYPTPGDPATGTPATRPGAYWHYQLQAELAAVLADAGLSPSAATLTQLRDTLRALSPTLLRAALTWPTVGTADYRLTVTPAAVSGQGGKVTVASGTPIGLALPTGNGSTGRTLLVNTPAFDSGNLLASSTYYLRGQIAGGALALYVQRGTDADAEPASGLGTPGGASGGGFDSTVFDVLLGKVVTSTSGTTPTVTALANAARLTASGSWEDVNTPVGGTTRTLTLNWGRAPMMAAVVSFGTAAHVSIDADLQVNQTDRSRMSVSWWLRVAGWDGFSTIAQYRTGALAVEVFG